MFDKEQFIADCRAAVGDAQTSRHIREIVARSVAAPDSIVRALGEPKPGGIETVHRSPELTILNVFWPPHMVVMPHNHTMWAVIGVYGGREDNIFWRRLPDESDGRIEAAGAKSLSTRDALAFGADLIHSVVNPSTKVTGALHIYGGDLLGTERSEWDPDTLTEKRYDTTNALRRFER